MLPTDVELIEFLDDSGRSPFRRWFEGLHAPARAKVAISIARIEQGNVGALKSLGGGVSEIRIDWGPGYRVYCGFDGAEIVILLGGGCKQRQDRDIADARARWADYKIRKKGN
jgi:putative addiction module killer protein